jgi:hypothetical protein
MSIEEDLMMAPKSCRRACPAAARRGIPLRAAWLLFVVVLLAATGCQGAAPTPPAQPPTAAPTSTPLPANTPLPPTGTPAPTDTPVPPTPTTEPPTATSAPTATPAPTETPAPSETPAPTATTAPSPTPDKPQATVKGTAINVRGGPGTDFPVIGQGQGGQSYEIVGRNDGSTWLDLCCFDGKVGWVSVDLVDTTADLAAIAVPQDLPVAAPAPAPTAAPTAKPVVSTGGAAPKGVLLYSIANFDANRWELWQYTFATGEAKYVNEWRTEVAFAPDYSQVAYFSWGPGTNNKPGIYAANADLSGERMIFEGAPAYPSYSPDKGRLAVQGGDKFYVMNADGSGIHAVDIGEYPAWSPIDNWIAHRGCYGADCGLWLTNADNNDRKRLTTGGGDGQPAWSPNGQTLAYISKDDGNFEIYRIERDGSNKTRLTDDPHSDGLPVWSPDGAWIAFRSDRSGKWAIYVMRPDGSDVRKLVDADVIPAWFFEKMAWRP